MKTDDLIRSAAIRMMVGINQEDYAGIDPTGTPETCEYYDGIEHDGADELEIALSNEPPLPEADAVAVVKKIGQDAYAMLDDLESVTFSREQKRAIRRFADRLLNAAKEAIEDSVKLVCE